VLPGLDGYTQVLQRGKFAASGFRSAVTTFDIYDGVTLKDDETPIVEH